MTRRLPADPAPGPLEGYSAQFDDLFDTLAGRQSRMNAYCNPYCNRADTHCYAMDKATPSDRRNPPQQA
jgi:hypothetical protein